MFRLYPNISVFNVGPLIPHISPRITLILIKNQMQCTNSLTASTGADMRLYWAAAGPAEELQH